MRNVEKTSLQRRRVHANATTYVKVYELRIFDFFVKMSLQLYAFLQNRQHLNIN